MTDMNNLLYIGKNTFQEGGIILKKFLLLFLLFIPTFTLAGCGDDELPEEGEDIEEIDVEEEDEIGDGEINDE